MAKDPELPLNLARSWLRGVDDCARIQIVLHSFIMAQMDLVDLQQSIEEQYIILCRQNHEESVVEDPPHVSDAGALLALASGHVAALDEVLDHGDGSQRAHFVVVVALVHPKVDAVGILAVEEVESLALRRIEPTSAILIVLNVIYLHTVIQGEARQAVRPVFHRAYLRLVPEIIGVDSIDDLSGSDWILLLLLTHEEVAVLVSRAVQAHVLQVSEDEVCNFECVENVVRGVDGQELMVLRGAVADHVHSGRALAG